MKQMIMRTVGALALSLTLVSPLAAQDEDCYDYWLKTCDAALKESNWYEKIAVGAYCTLMFGTCALNEVTIQIS